MSLKTGSSPKGSSVLPISCITASNPPNQSGSCVYERSISVDSPSATVIKSPIQLPSTICSQCLG